MRRRRRRNPSTLTYMSNFLTLGVVAAIAYVGFKYVMPLLKGIGKTAAGATNSLTTAIANTLVSPSTVQKNLAGSVVLSTGQEVPVSQLSNVQPLTLSDGTPSASFVFQNQTWQFTGPADDTGTYYAVPSNTAANVGLDWGISDSTTWN